jgi:mono/diheme cytochrome c family protein
MRDSSFNLPRYTQAPRPPAGGRLPGWLRVVLIGVPVAAAIPLAIAAKARVNTSSEPRIQLIQDMAFQPKYRTQARSDVFEDGRAMRAPISGVVARGRADDDDHYYRGYSSTTDAAGNETLTYFDGFPTNVKVTPELVERGEQRFNIYCAACHGRDGSGTGPIHRSASTLAAQGLANWTPPMDLNSEQVRTRPAGHIYNTINMGIRNMPAHGPQIATADRWAIVAYVRSLQISRGLPPAQPTTLPTARSK